MNSITGVQELDVLIISHLDPPQILTVSELNTYFNKLTDLKRSQFINVKHDIRKSMKSDWIARWHIKCMSNAYEILDIRKMPNNKIDTFDYLIMSSLRYNQREFTRFLIESVKKVSINTLREECGLHMMSIFENEVDMNFINYVDECFKHTFGVTFLSIYDGRAYNYDEILKIFWSIAVKQKKYTEALFFLRQSPQSFAYIGGKLFTHFDLDRFRLADHPSDFLCSLFELLQIEISTSNEFVLPEACELPDDKVFFQLLSDKLHWPSTCYQDIFVSACTEGKISIVKWLLNHPSQQSDLLNLNAESTLHSRSINTFGLVCYYGHMDMVKWFLSPDQPIGPIDIHWDNDSALFFACVGGHVDVCNYLISVGGNTPPERQQMNEIFKQHYGTKS